jgi:hypothetical protein
MSLILIGTALVGLLASKLLLLSHVTNMVLRYPLAVIISYLAFFGFIKLWLSYITLRAENSSPEASDVLDGITSVPDFSSAPGPSVGSFSGGGGGTGGGGGVTGSFDVAGTDASPGSVSTIFDSVMPGEGAGSAAGDAASGIAEEGGFVLIVLGILLAIVFGAGLYMIYDAPYILSEAAFEFILSAGLIKSMKKIDDAEWKGSVLRTTWMPFVVVLLITLVAAGIIHSQYPEAHKLWEILRK